MISRFSCKGSCGAKGQERHRGAGEHWRKRIAIQVQSYGAQRKLVNTVQTIHRALDFQLTS